MAPRPRASPPAPPPAQMRRRRRGGVLGALAVLGALGAPGPRGAGAQALSGVVMCMQGKCHADCEQYCLDRCTLDGQRESPCEYECDPLTKQCFDLCELQMYDPGVELNKDQFDMECTKRFAKSSAARRTSDAAKPERAAQREPPAPSSGLVASPWPMFRGNLRRTGRTTVQGPQTRYELSWQFRTGGPVVSSPAFDGDGDAYVGSGDGYLYAFLQSGELKWRHRTGAALLASPALGNFIGSDFAVSNPSSDGVLRVISATFGTDRAAFARRGGNGDAPNGDGGAAGMKWGLGFSSPAIGPEGSVYVGSANGAMYAFHGSSGSGGTLGTARWTFLTRGPVLSSPALVLRGDPFPPYRSRTPPYAFVSEVHGVLVFGSNDGFVYGLDSNDGGMLWRYRTSGAVTSSPAVDSEGVAYVGSRDGGVYALNTTTGAPIWRFRTDGAVESSPALSEGDNSLFVASADAHLYSVNTTDGRLLWKQRLGRAETLSPALPFGLPEEEGASTAYEGVEAIQRRRAVELLQSETACGLGQLTDAGGLQCSGTGPGMQASPLYAGGILYQGSNDGMFYALGPSDGRILWEMEVDGAVTSSAGIGPTGVIVFGTSSGTVYGVRA